MCSTPSMRMASTLSAGGLCSFAICHHGGHQLNLPDHSLSVRWAVLWHLLLTSIADSLDPDRRWYAFLHATPLPDTYIQVPDREPLPMLRPLFCVSYTLRWAGA